MSRGADFGHRASPRSLEPRPGEDYYSSGHEPTELLAEWGRLRHECALLERQQCGGAAGGRHGHLDYTDTLGQPSPSQRRRRSQRNPSKSRSPSRSPRSTLALDLHYDRQQQLQRQQSAERAGDGDGESQEGPSPAGVDDGTAGAAPETAATRRARRVPYTQAADPYDRSRELARQEQFLSEARRLGRPFVPASNAEDAPTRLMLGDCVRDLYKCVAKDWPEAEPMAVSTAEDLIVLYFSLSALSKEKTGEVLQYMKAFAQRNETVREFKLDRVVEAWDLITDDGHLMYTFRPPWVRKSRRFLPDTVNPPTAHVQ